MGVFYACLILVPYHTRDLIVQQRCDHAIVKFAWRNAAFWSYWRCRGSAFIRACIPMPGIHFYQMLLVLLWILSQVLFIAVQYEFKICIGF